MVKLTVFSVVVSLIYTILFIMLVIVVCVNSVQCNAISHNVLYDVLYKCDTWGLSLSVLGLITPDSERPDPLVSDWPQISSFWLNVSSASLQTGTASLSCVLVWAWVLCLPLWGHFTVQWCHHDARDVLHHPLLLHDSYFYYLISIFLFLCCSRLILSSLSWHSSIHAWLPCYNSSN